MKGIILICLLLVSSNGFGLCLPESLEAKKSDNKALLHLEDLAQELQGNYQSQMSADKELVIVFQTFNPRVNAEIKNVGEQLVLELYGGMLSHPKMNENSFRLLLCHELGHYFGGAPLKSRTGWSSTEGQADYYSGNQCARFLSMDESSFIEGAIDLTAIYAEVMREAPPKLDQCDERQVDRTNYGYPSVQCRLQTILAGWRDEPRPRCWFRQ